MPRAERTQKKKPPDGKPPGGLKIAFSEETELPAGKTQESKRFRYVSSRFGHELRKRKPSRGPFCASAAGRVAHRRGASVKHPKGVPGLTGQAENAEGRTRRKKPYPLPWDGAKDNRAPLG